MNNYGNRGSVLELMINKTIDIYREKKIALIQKIPTPILPIKLDKSSNKITKAFFEKKSTVDYIGVVQEIPICFDAKECQVDTFPLSNIHEHQYKFMEEFEEQGGISFLLVLFSKRNIVYYIPFKTIKEFVIRSKTDKKSFNISELDINYSINIEKTNLVYFIDKIQMDLNNR